MKVAAVSTLLFGAASAFAPSNTATRQGTALASSGKDEGEMSKALPFAPRPKLLDGTLAGDVGFE